MTTNEIARRSVLLGAGGAALAGITGSGLTATAAAPATAAGRPHCAPALWRLAAERGITYGSATSTRLFDDEGYSRLVDREAAIVFTEDDLLWYQLKPTPTSPLDFSYGDRFFAAAEKAGQLVFAAHLVWDEGFGDGWTEDDLWGLDRAAARKLLFGVERALVSRYRGRVAGWIVANEVTDPEGIRGVRTNVPWYETIGASYIPDAFHLARHLDHEAVLVLNEFGFETTNEYGDDPVDRQKATLQVIDWLLHHHVPVDALGIQAHLLAPDFAERFDRKQYRRFLAEVAHRGLDILVTELDVLDDGLPADVGVRDRKVADIYRRYLDVTLDQPAVKAVMSFELSDRYTWLQEDYPRDDGAERRPLPYDSGLQAKPARRAIASSLRRAPHRRPLWKSPRRHHHH
jgi:endo-1,4-beta-xylanase